MHQPKLITLTLRKSHGRRSDLARIHSLRNALFHKLRYEGYRIAGWIGVVEYPNHIHMVVDSDYIPQNLLSKYWYDQTGDSYIVDVRRINLASDSLKGTSRYMAKYLGKGSELHFDDVDLLKGFHMVQSYGIEVDGWKNPLCSCGCDSPMIRLTGKSIDAYLTWWENDSGPPFAG